MRFIKMLCGALLGLVVAGQAAGADFDHTYGGLAGLLERHVEWTADGGTSVVDYAGFKADEPALDSVLARFSAVSPDQFAGFGRDQKLAFLINTYNAFTVKFILTAWPDIRSIKDLGSFFSSPWKKSFFSLLGQPRTLDWIEHERIREPGAFDEPRIHFVVNCASIGCPALRPEPMLAGRLDAQFDDSVHRFLGDRSRNRFDAGSNTLEVSRIFDWYGDDFEKGHQGIRTLRDFFAAHAQRLADDPQAQARIRAGRYELDFLDYDWSLNKAR